MWWDGPYDGVSDCSPRFTELLAYAGGTRISTSTDTLNPWSSIKSISYRSFGITAAGISGQIHSLTTAAPHGIVPGGSFELKGFLPVSWGGSFTAIAGTAGSQIYFKPASNLGAITQEGEVRVGVLAAASIYPARDCIIEFPAGKFVFKTPLPNLPQVVIRGASKLSTYFVKQFHGGIFFQQNGSLGNGLIIERLAVLADPRYRPGYFCQLTGGAVYQPDNFQLKDLYVSQFGAITGSSPPGGGLWQHGIVIDGIARTSPQGVRIGLIENCEIFNCQSSGVWIRNGAGIRMGGGGLFPGAAGGDYPAGTAVYVTGGVTNPLEQSINCHFQGVVNNCPLNISKSSYCTWVGGSIGGLATDDSLHWMIRTLNSGTVANNLVDSNVTLVPPPA